MSEKMLVTIFPNDGGDLFDAQLHDDNDTVMVYDYDSLCEFVDEYWLESLVEGEEITVELPRQGSFSHDEFAIINAAIVKELENDWRNDWTDEQIHEHQMLHGYHPFE